MTNLVYPLGVIAASLAVLGWRRSVEQNLESTLSLTLQRRLERGGATLSGDPLGSYELDAVVDGEKVHLERTAVTQPGPGEQSSVSVTRVTVRTDAALTLLVCRRNDEATMMGPVPPVPRTPTGDSDFDANYRCFLTPVASAEGYRDASSTRALAWAVPALLAPLRALELRWMQARDGVLHLAFAPLSGDDPRRAMELGANVAHALRGEPLRTLSTAPRDHDKPQRVSHRAMSSLYGALGASVSVGPMLGIGLAFTGLMHPLYEAEVCGPGAHLQTTSSSIDGGTSYGMICVGGQDADADGFVLRCIITSVALMFALAALNALRPVDVTRRFSLEDL